MWWLFVSLVAAHSPEEPVAHTYWWLWVLFIATLLFFILLLSCGGWSYGTPYYVYVDPNTPHRTYYYGEYAAPGNPPARNNQYTPAPYEPVYQDLPTAPRYDRINVALAGKRFRY